MTKRIISMVLALSMLLSLMPVSAFADTGGGIFSAPPSNAELEEHNAPDYSIRSPGSDLGIDENYKPYNTTDSSKTSGKKWEYDRTSDTLKLHTDETDAVSFYFGGKTIQVKKLVIDGFASQNHTIQYGTFKSPDGGPILLEIESSSNVTLHGITFDGDVTWDTQNSPEVYLYGGNGGIIIQGDLNLYSDGTTDGLSLDFKNAYISGTLSSSGNARNYYSIYFNAVAPSVVHKVGLSEDQYGFFNASQLTTTNGNCKIMATYADGMTATFDADTDGKNSAWVTTGTSVTLTGDDTCDGWNIQSDNSTIAPTYKDDYRASATFTMPKYGVTATAYDALVIGKNETPTTSGGSGWKYENGTLTIEEGHTFNFGVENYAYTGDLSKYHIVRYDAANTQQIIHRCNVVNNGTIVGMAMCGDESVGSATNVTLTNTGTGLITDSSFKGLPGKNVTNDGKIMQSQFGLSGQDSEYGLPAMTGISDSVFLLTQARTPEMHSTLKNGLKCLLISSASEDYRLSINYADYAYFYGNYDPVANKRKDFRLYFYRLYNVNGKAIDDPEYKQYFSLDDGYLSSSTYYLSKLPTDDLVLNQIETIEIGAGHKPTAASGASWTYDNATDTLRLSTVTFDLSDQPYTDCKVIVDENATLAGGAFTGEVQCLGTISGGTFTGKVLLYDENSTTVGTVTGGVFVSLSDQNVTNGHAPDGYILVHPYVASPDNYSFTLTLNGVEWPLETDSSYGRQASAAYVYGENTTLTLNSTAQRYWAPYDDTSKRDTSTDGWDWSTTADSVTFTPSKGATILNTTDFTVSSRVYNQELVFGKDGKPAFNDDWFMLYQKDADGNYLGDGWKYEPNANNGEGRLTITRDLTQNTNGYTGSSYISVPVVLEGEGKLKSFFVLKNKPTGSGANVSAYHSIKLANPVSGALYVKDEMTDTSTIRELWMAEGGNVRFLQLTGTQLYNIDGKSLTEYGSYYSPTDSISSLTMGDADIILNAPLALSINADGKPTGSEPAEGSISDRFIGSIDSNGQTWYYANRTLYLEKGDFDFGGEIVRCEVNLADGVSIKNGVFERNVTGSGQNSVQDCVFALGPSGLNYEAVPHTILELPTRSSINGLDLGYTTRVIVYGNNTGNFKLTIYDTHEDSPDSSYWVAQDSKDTEESDGHYLSEAELEKIGWNYDSTTGALTFNLNKDTPKTLYLKSDTYDDILRIGKNGRPDVDNNTYRKDGNVYSGYGWTYDPTANDGNGLLTITGRVRAYGYIIDPDLNVVIDGTQDADALLAALMSNKPSCINGAQDIYHKLSATDSFTLEGEPDDDDEPTLDGLTELWLAEGSYHSLSLTKELVNVNGEPIEDYVNDDEDIGPLVPTFDEEEGEAPLTYDLTMPAYDLTLNQTLNLKFDADGWPSASAGGTKSVGATDEEGRVWYYNADSIQKTLLLQKGEFDFTDSGVVNCNWVEVGKDASIAGGIFLCTVNGYIDVDDPNYQSSISGIFVREVAHNSQPLTMFMLGDGATLNGVDRSEFNGYVYIYGSDIELRVVDQNVKPDEDASDIDFVLELALLDADNTETKATLADFDGKMIDSSTGEFTLTLGNKGSYGKTIRYAKAAYLANLFIDDETGKPILYPDGEDGMVYRQDADGNYLGRGWKYTPADAAENADTLTISDSSALSSDVYYISSKVVLTDNAQLPSTIVLAQQPTGGNSGSYRRIVMGEKETTGKLSVENVIPRFHELWVHQNYEGSIYSTVLIYNLNGRARNTSYFVPSFTLEEPAAGTGDVIVNQTLELAFDAATGKPLDADGNPVSTARIGGVTANGSRWDYEPDTSGDDLDTLTLRSGTFNFKGQNPMQGDELRVESGVKIQNGVFYAQDYDFRFYNSAAERPLENCLLLSSKGKPNVSGGIVIVHLPSSCTAINGINLDSSDGDMTAYVYGKVDLAVTVRSAKDCWTATVSSPTGRPLTEAEKAALKWDDTAGDTLKLTVDDSDPVAIELCLDNKAYETGLFMDEDGMPDFTSGGRVFQHTETETGTVYYGAGWEYDTAKNLLTVTAADPGVIAQGTRLVACDVELKGEGAVLYGALTKEPTLMDGASAAYYSLYFADGTPLAYVLDPADVSNTKTVDKLWLAQYDFSGSYPFNLKRSDVVNVNTNSVDRYTGLTWDEEIDDLAYIHAGNGDIVLNAAPTFLYINNNTRKPDIQDTYPKNADGLYYGTGWTYDAEGEGTLTLSSSDVLLASTAFLACHVVLEDGVTLPERTILAYQPEGDDGENFHAATIDSEALYIQGVTPADVYYQKLWLRSGTGHDIALHDALLYNLNGASLDDVTYTADRTSVYVSMGDEDVTINQPLEFDPDLLDGSSIGGMTEDYTWFYEDKYSRTLTLEGGRFDFGSRRVTCDVIMDTDVELVNGMFTGQVVRNSSTGNKTGTIINSIFSHEIVGTDSFAPVDRYNLSLPQGTTVYHYDLGTNIWVYNHQGLLLENDKADYWSAADGDGKALSDDLLTAMNWNDRGSSVIFTLPEGTPSVLQITCGTYTTALKFDADGYPVLDGVRQDGTGTYHGDTWTYSEADGLIVTGDTYADGAFVRCKVTLDGPAADLYGYFVLLQAPVLKNTAPDNFVHAAYADGTKFGIFDLYNGNVALSGVSEIWTHTSFSLVLITSTNAEITDINGKDLKDFQANSIPYDDDHIVFSMQVGTEDLVFNQNKIPQPEKTATLTVNGKPETRTVGEEVKVTAEDREGFTFNGWTVEGVTLTEEEKAQKTISFFMPENDVTLTANYKKIETPEPEKTATLTVNGVPEIRTVGEEVKVTAEDRDGFTFNGWTVEGVILTEEEKALKTISFFMPENDVILTANYKKIETPEPEKTATLTVNGVPETRTVGEEVKVTAEDREGFTFNGWTVEGVTLTEEEKALKTISFFMPENDVILTANYKKIEIPQPEKTATLTVNGKPETRTVGEEVKITAEDREGFTFNGWTVEGVTLTEEEKALKTISFFMPENDVTLTANYKKIETPEPEKTATLTVNGKPETRTVGEEVKVTAEDREGFTFNGWTVEGVTLTEEEKALKTISFFMPENDVTLTANYKKVEPDPGPENPDKPDQPTGTYQLTVTGADVTLADGTAVADLTAVPVGTELIATAYADTETSAFKQWVTEDLDLTDEQLVTRTLAFTMPDHDVTLATLTGIPGTDPAPKPGGSGGGGGAIVAVAAAGGVAVGIGAYVAGTTAYLRSVLPEGMAIPTNREQLAVALWTAAGKPQTQSTTVFSDVPADSANLQAIRWAVETGLLAADGTNFKPGRHVTRVEVIRVWKLFQQR